jgi:hypothetical protein
MATQSIRRWFFLLSEYSLIRTAEVMTMMLLLNFNIEGRMTTPPRDCIIAIQLLWYQAHVATCPCTLEWSSGVKMG